MIGFVKSFGSRRVFSSIVSERSRERKSKRFLDLFEDFGFRRSGIAVVDSGFTSTVYGCEQISGRKRMYLFTIPFD